MMNERQKVFDLCTVLSIYRLLHWVSYLWTAL